MSLRPIINNLLDKLTAYTKLPIFPVILLIFIITGIYYKLVIFGKIPLPADLLVASYSPWFDYYKLPVQNPLISDAFSQFFLWKHLAVDIFKSGNWPLWNPYSFMGTPLLATYHSATLYPPNLLLLLPKYWGWGLFIFSQTLIAALTLNLLLSLWVKSTLARIAGSIIFALGGLMTTWLELGTAGHAIAWLPLIIYSIEKFSQTTKFRFFLLLIFSMVLLFLAGNAQITTFSFFIALLYGLFCNFKVSKISHLNLIYLLLAFILMAALVSPQLLPSFELTSKSIRINEGYIGEFNYGLLTTKDAFKFFMADFWGNPVTRNYWGFLNYAETSGFVGSLTLPLLLFSLVYLKKNVKVAFFLLLCLTSLILSFDNPISQFLYRTEIPLLTSSYASRMLFVSVFSISILAAFSLNQIILRKQEGKLIKTVIWSWAAVIGCLLGLLLTYYQFNQIYKSSYAKDVLATYLSRSDLNVPLLIISAKNSLPAFIQYSLVLLIFLIIKISPLKKFDEKKLKFFYILFTLFIILDLSRYFLKFNPFVDQNIIFPEVSEIKILQEKEGVFRVGREHAEILPPNTWIAYNLQTYEGYDPLYLLEYGEFMNFLNLGKFETGGTSRYAELSSNYKSPYLDIANVRYFIATLRDSTKRIPGEHLDSKFTKANYKLIYKGRSFALLENPNALERAYFTPSIEFLKEKQVKKVFEEDKEHDPRKKVFLSESLNLDKVTGKGIVKIVDYSPNKIKLQTSTQQSEVLVLADKFDDGWEVTVDGNPTKIVKANLIFRAIKVPPGKHNIEFYYWPKSFDIGLKLSTFTIILLISSTLIFLKLKRF
ncbi:hypothetical protein A3B45_03270 [Candidatus Daviesbacteria bacterium RIFCSPLOWO2_01_FULL_39_12]|uniref:YfhO family protein n=1 Tax=Candidatus Daviesbacteria bacterium RIFCSPLOWO2_01_FULL_39_12 TaxID=1797785 RepID=A0A1F5KRZ8_9BACT|nr:MAG: hypothetical protein A3B45_03270 [Candidatus Daviesbacteria bacterium RIFCSPLOWO2_01_FULL_39_12]